MISRSSVSTTGNVPVPERAGTVRRFFSALYPMTPDRHIRFIVPGVLLLAALLAGCEDPGTGTLDPRGNPPFLKDAAVTPDSINLGSLTPGPSGLLAVALATVRVTDPDQGGVLTATVEVYPLANEPPRASTALHDDGIAPDANAGDGIYSARVQFQVTESDAGRFRVRFSAVDDLGLRGNTVERSLLLARPKENAPPELSALIAPDTVTLPATGSLLVTMSVVVTDSDGYGDIRDVYFRSLNSSDPTRRFFLKDDGGAGTPSSGDTVAGDGRFSIIVQLPSTTPRRDYTFAFQASDAPGDTSATLLHVLTVR